MILEDITGHPVKGLYFHCASVGQGKTRAMLTHAGELTKKGKVLYVNDEDRLDYIHELMSKPHYLIKPENFLMAQANCDWSGLQLECILNTKGDHLFLDCNTFDFTRENIELIMSHLNDFKSIHVSVLCNQYGNIPNPVAVPSKTIWYAVSSRSLGLKLKASDYYNMGKGNWFEFNAVD